jgi:hypothetical protein
VSHQCPAFSLTFNHSLERNRLCEDTHCGDGFTESQRGNETFLRSHSEEVILKLVFGLNLTELSGLTLSPSESHLK